MAHSRRRQNGRATISRFALSLVLLTYLGFFVFLSGDSLVRMFMIRGAFDSVTDATAVIFLEGSRTIALALCLLLAESVVRSTGTSRTLRLYTLFLGFLGIWYAKAAAFEAFPGHAQEWMAGHLLGAGIPLEVLRFLFGAPEWAVWIAAGAALRLSVTWPRSVTSQSIGVSGRHDREGLLRAVAFAGLDVGAVFRRMAGTAATRGLLGPAIVWPVVVIAGTAHSLIDAPAARIAFAAGLAFVLAVVITNARAGMADSNMRQQQRLIWIAVAAITAMAAFLAASILSLGADPISPVLGVAVASLAPFGVLAALAGVTRPDPGEARPWLGRALLIGAGSVTGSIAYHLSLAALPSSAGPEIPVREMVALATSVVLVTVMVPALRQLADRLSAPAGARHAPR